jgi:hypothetical protein
MKTNYKTQVRRSRLQIKYYDCSVIDVKFVIETPMTQKVDTQGG